MRRAAAVLILAVIVCCGWTARAGDLPAPAGPVVLTVAGAIANPNRGPFDAFGDAFLNTLGVRFDRAAEFDRSMLQALGETEIITGYPTWPKRFTFAGPLLRDVLAAAGAGGETIRVHALDGYVAEIPRSDLTEYPIILALSRDGRPLALGGHGPAWIIYPRESFPALAERDDALLVWSVVYIEVE